MVKIINKFFSLLLLSSFLFSSQTWSKEIEMNTAKLQAMDKITGRVSVLDAPVNTLVSFGSFSILVRACKTRPPEETPDNFAFVDVVDINQNNEKTNIFKGWMISSSPALHAVEHPIYDVWLLKCLNSDVDKSKLLNSEQLKARDEIPLRQENLVLNDILSGGDDTQNFNENSDFQNLNPTPDNIITNSETQNLSLEPITPQQASFSEDGAPEVLINLSNDNLLNSETINESSLEGKSSEVVPDNSVEEISESLLPVNQDENISLSSEVIPDNQTIPSTENPVSEQNNDNLGAKETITETKDANFIEFSIDDDVSPELNPDALNI